MERVHPKMFKRWSSIYCNKLRNESYVEAKAWIVRTLDAALIDKVRPYIERDLGVRK